MTECARWCWQFSPINVQLAMGMNTDHLAVYNFGGAFKQTQLQVNTAIQQPERGLAHRSTQVLELEHNKPPGCCVRPRYSTTDAKNPSQARVLQITTLTTDVDH